MHWKATLTALCFAATLPAPAWPANVYPEFDRSPRPPAVTRATAVAARAGATRLERCVEAGDTLLADLVQRNFMAASADFDADARATYSAGHLAEGWRSLGARFGKLESRGAPRSALYDDHALVMLPLQLAKGRVKARLTCNAQGRLTGFHIVSIEPPPAPSQ